MCPISDPPYRPLIQVSSKHNTGSTFGLYTEGDTLQLECKSMGGYPVPRLEWLIDQEPVESRFVTYLFGYIVCISPIFFFFYSSSKTSATLTMSNVSLEEDGALLTCRALQLETGEMKTSSLKITVRGKN